MSRKAKVIISIAAVLTVVAAGAYIYIKSAAPPGEEWISYNNNKVIETIDAQLKGMDIENLVKEKENFVVEKSIQDIQSEVEKGNLSYEEITAICLYRIKTLDQKEKGYNSVISVNTHAIEQAREKDLNRQNQDTETGMYGIPVMLKDNINTADMVTTAGAEAFSDFYPSEDAVLVENLKNEGAIILGKNNLTEFAGYVSGVMPAGYSGSKGQTINPFGPLNISASGSSSGSAVAVTANLVPVSVGTETDGSVIAPASANSVVGYKPTRGNIPTEGIFPLIKKIDTAGLMGKTVKDTAAAYNAASGSAISSDFDEDALKGKTIGLLRYEYNDGELLDELEKNIKNAGAEIMPVELNEQGIVVFNDIALSFKRDFEDYADTYGLPIKTLSGLIKYNEEDSDRRIKYGQDWLLEAEKIKSPDMDKIDESIEAADKALSSLFQKHHLDGIAFLNSSGTTAPAAAGYPVLTVPFTSTGEGAPQGAAFIAGAGEDEKLLNMGYSFETNVKGRLVP